MGRKIIEIDIDWEMNGFQGEYWESIPELDKIIIMSNRLAVPRSIDGIPQRIKTYNIAIKIVPEDETLDIWEYTYRDIPIKDVDQFFMNYRRETLLTHKYDCDIKLVVPYDIAIAMVDLGLMADISQTKQGSNVLLEQRIKDGKFHAYR